MLKHFKINADRDLLAPNFACYQMNLIGPVNAAIQAGEVDEDFKLLPSWAKFVAHPIKSKGFFTRTLQALFLGQGGHDQLNVDLQTEDYGKTRVAMMFMPANTRSDMIDLIGEQAREVLTGYKVIVVNGQQKYNGKRITNKNAQPVVKEVVAKGKPTLIIAAQMAQRSFSIPEITELYLAYDRGQNGATIQKMSRTLTPGTLDKVGRIFSLSFDPNRDDKFDSMVIETALNYKKRHQAKSLREAMKDVLRTIDIYSCQEDGAVELNVDSYLEAALARKGISRVLGKIVNLTVLDADAITALANGNNDYFRSESQEKAEKGKTREPQQKKKGGKSNADSTKKEIAKARETIVNIVENLDVIMLSGDSNLLLEALTELDNDMDRAWVLEEFGVDLDLIYYLLNQQVIKQDWVELMLEKG